MPTRAADHVLYLRIIMVRERFDIWPVITLKTKKAQTKWNVKRWKILIILALRSLNLPFGTVWKWRMIVWFAQIAMLRGIIFSNAFKAFSDKKF